MKPETGKKNKKWLWIAIAIAVLLIAAAVAAILVFKPGSKADGDGDPTGTVSEQTPGDEIPASAVYWNLDRIQYTQDPEAAGLSTRTPGEDGLYTFRFASEGKIVELKTADKQLVNYIDTMDAVGLVLDADGLIIDVLNVKDIAVEKAKNFYVKKVDGNTVTVNSSIAMNGMDITVVLTDAAGVMDVRPGSETMGQTIDLQVFDMVSIYCTKEGEVVTAVYLHERPESSPLYMRIDRLYDSATASTTRVPDSKGVYTIPFSLYGEIVNLKCKDKTIVTGIDSGTDAKQVMGLTFDEEGFITGTITAATAARGKIMCQVYNVSAINGNAIEATRLMSGNEQGKVVNFNLTEETVILMNEDGCGHFIGERVDDLKMHDRVIVWSDMDNNAIYIKIDRRKVEDPAVSMYYLKGKKWNSTTLETSRLPDANGYYVFELANKGKMVTVKTKDKKMANLMDGNSYQFFGLKVQGGIVKQYYDKDCLSGGYGIGGQRFVTEVMANIVRIVSGSDFASGGNYILTEKTEIYNMTGYNGKLGSKTELKVGDRVIASRDVENNITHIYVLDRPAASGTKFYYNSSRKWNGTTLETSRVPDAEGYYVYTMYCEGNEVTVKTKDKAIANIIDEQNAPIAAMKVNKDGVITAAYPAIAGKKYATKVFNYNYVGEISKETGISCYYYSNGVKTPASKSYPMAKGCKIYNVSTNYSDHRGEKASLKLGDRIQALADIETGELTHIWIMGRSIDSPVYFHANRVAPKNGVTQRVPNAEGYYEVELFADGKISTYKTKSQDIMSAVDAYGSESFFALKTDGNIILAVDGVSSSTRAANQVVSFRDVTKISGKNVTVTRMRPGGTDHLQQTEFKMTSKTKVYDICYYSENQFKEVKLEKGDRVSVFADRDGNVTYVFVMYPHTREEGYQSKCSHCNKTVWWEPYCGSFIQAENVHYYYPTDYVRGSQGTVGVDLNSKPGTERYTAVFDLNGRTYTSKARNFLVYFDLVLIDSVGGGILQSTGYQGGSGGNFMVLGGTVEVNDGITIRMLDDPNSRSGAGGNFSVGNFNLKDGDGKVVGTNVGKVTINDAKLEGWPNSSGNFLMNSGTVLNLNGGSVSGGNIELVGSAKFNWKGGAINSNITVNGGVLPLEGTPAFDGMLLTSNGGKVDISKLSTDARIKALPAGVFTTESDNIDAYLDVFVPAAESINIIKEGKALSASFNIPAVTDNLEFVPGTQMAVCPVCEAMVTWTPITQEAYGEQPFGTPAGGQHIYLAEDIVHTGNTTNFMNAPSRNTETNEPLISCWHLNGHNFTATNRNVIHGSYGILNVMGSGVMSGNGSNGATITINTNKDTGGINLISGTFTKVAGNKTGVAQINANGGTIWVRKDAVIETAEDDLAISVGTSSLIPSVLEIYGTVKGGYVTMADAKPEAGFTNTFVLDGGNVEGGIKLSATNIIGLGGAAKVGGFGLDLTSGAKVLVSELTEGASVAVAANGVFTHSIDVAGQKGYYAPAPKYFAIQEVGDTLSTSRDPNAAPDLPKDPATPTKPTILSVDNSNLVFEEGTTNAKCPVCGDVVEWIAITDATEMVNLEGEKHYYLANDITYAGTSVAIQYEVYQQKVTCLHLNGHNITATAGKAIYSGGYLNVMGNGIVIGNGNVQHRGATVEVNSAAARLNLYGGTYKVDAANTTNVIVNVHGNGGEINLYDGAIIDISDNAGNMNAVRSWCGAFNMYGGLVKGGKGTAISASNWTKRTDGTGSGTINIFGGEVLCTSGAAVYAGGTTGALGHLGIYGGKITGSVGFNINAEAVIGGNPVMNRLNITTDCTFTLGKLTEGADITVNAPAGTVFTKQSDNVETYKNYFKASAGNSIGVSNFALAVVAGGSTEPEQPVLPDDPKVPAKPSKLSVDNSNLVFEAGTTNAKCPVCEKVVTWTAITDLAEPLAVVGDTHYYLANDITYTGTATAIAFNYNSAYKGMTSCLHLNGKNLTATNGIAIFVGMKMNIMGNGTVSGNNDANGRASTLEVNSTAAVLNLYGGTYVKPAANERDLVAMNSAGGIFNVYQGVTFDGRDRKGNAVRLTNGTLNVYGGEIYGGSTGYVIYANAGTAKINNVPTPVAGTINFFGGLAQAAKASGLGAVGNADVKANMNIYGGEIRGGSVVNGTTNVIIGGTAKMNRLVVNEGAKFTLAEMSEGASITLSANGIFTNPSKNAANYVKYFHGLTNPTAYKTPTVVDNALFTEQGTDPVNPDPGTQPEPEKPKFDNSNLVFEEGTTKAKCPVCDKVVEWTAITQAANGTTPLAHTNTDGMHYYLAEDITYTGADAFITGPGSSKSLCIHLNGHNWTSTQAIFLFGYGSKSRVMGNGIVANGRNDARQGAITWNTGTKTNVDIQLYGGTYTVTPENTNGHAISINNNGGDITIHPGVTVIGSSTAPAIYVGISNIRTSVLNINGATVYGSVKIENCKDKATYATTVVVEDSKLNVVELGKDVSFTVKGNTTIEKLIVTEGAKFTVGVLGANAKINVQGNGIITEASANVNTYKNQLVSTYGCELKVENNALVARDLNKIDNSNLVFAEGTTTAVCPYCQKSVEWEAISDDTAQVNLQGKKHYYLAKDLNFSTLANTGTALMYDVYGEVNMSCLHLNGHNLISNGRAIYPGGYMNIMGNGIVSGNYTHATQIRGATLDVNGAASSRLNLFGGTYTKAAENTRMPVMAFFINGGNINMYAGATIDGTNTSVNAIGSAGCLLIDNTEGKPGNFTMYGGTIKNGTNASSHGGNVRVNAYGNFTMYDGTISGGAAPIEYGGNIYVAGGTLNLLGGSVLNGNARMGGNIATQKNATAGVSPVMVLKNVTISGGWGEKNPAVAGSVSHGGNISIERTNLTIEDGTVIKDGNAGSQGGNLRALYCNITMNGGYVFGGKCSGGPTANVWVVGSASEVSSFTMNGGVIIASSNKEIGAGNALSVTANATVTFAGPAMIVSNPENPNKPVKIDGTLVKDPSWTGFAATNKD